MGSLQEAGSGIPKRVGDGRNKKKMCSIAQYFATELYSKCAEARTTTDWAGNREAGCPAPTPDICDAMKQV